MKDAQLLELLRQRDPQAVEQLLLHHGPLMRYIIAPILSDPGEREECLSDAAMRAWEQIGSFDPEKGKLTTWLSVLTRNLALNRARSAAHPLRAAAPLDPDRPDPAPGPEEEVLLRERRQTLQDLLAQLSHGDRAIFYRKYYYLQSTAQIAAETGSTVRAVEGRLYRIKQRLRRQLGGDGHD